MTTLIWLDSLDSSLSASFRPDDTDLTPIVKSFRANGFDLARPITVALDCTTVLEGHCRVAALRWLAEHDPAAFRAVLPGGRVPCKIDTTRVAI